MRELVIQRLEHDSDCCLGLLAIDRKAFCWTLELPFLDNQPSISCIPKGLYTCRRYSSPSHPRVWQVCDVPMRSDVLIHAGNTVLDTSGCVLLGTIPGYLSHRRAVLQSRDMFEAFMSATQSDETLQLAIREVWL